MLDYDNEAERYDATRGGEPRADAAAAAISSLLPGSARDVVDVACGTGIVTVRLVTDGRSVRGVDRSPGMAAYAALRLPGRIAVGDVTRLPLASGSADAVTMVWLLHLLSADAAARAVAEAARVLPPGGLLITTVNKNDAEYSDADDASALARRLRETVPDPQADDLARVLSIARAAGLDTAGPAAAGPGTCVSGATFTGLGQGRTPGQWAKRLASGHVPWTKAAGQSRMDALYEELAALPGQDRPRPDPVYRLAALRKTGAPA